MPGHIVTVKDIFNVAWQVTSHCQSIAPRGSSTCTDCCHQYGHCGDACNAQLSLQSLLRCSHLAAQELEGSITEMMPWNCWVVHSSQRVRSPSMVRKGQFSQPLCKNCKQQTPLEMQRIHAH